MTHDVIPTQNLDPGLKLRFMHHLLPTLIVFGLAIWPIFLSPSMPFFWALVSIVPGLCFGLSLFLLGYGTRQILITDRRKRSVAKLEQKLLNKEGELDVTALARLTDQHRRLGRMWAGEFLSKQLLQLAEQSDEHLMETGKLRSTDCFVSTPAYHNSMTCFTLDSTQSHGVLYLTDKVLAMESREIFFSVPLESITSVTIDKLPSWCMMPHSFVVVRFMHEGETHEVHLNPAPSVTISLKSINSAVEKWHAILNEAITGARSDQMQLITTDDLKSELVVRSISLPQRFVNCALSQPFVVALSLTFMGFFTMMVPFLVTIIHSVAQAPISPF